MAKQRIAIATNGKKGLEDTVSNVFGKAQTFTIIDVEDEKIVGVKVLDNPALAYSHGAGPIAIKTLEDDGARMIIADELGFGASEILQQHNITHIQAKPGTNVGKAVEQALSTQKKLSKGN